MPSVDFSECLCLLRKRTRHRYARAEARNDLRFAGCYDRMHVDEWVRARGRKATSQRWLLDRLGKALTKRREYIRHCGVHQQKIATYLPKPDIYPEVTSQRQSPTLAYNMQSPRLAKTQTACSRPSAVMTTASTILPTAPLVDDGFDDRDTSTVASSICFGNDPNALTIPSMGDFGVPGMPFECPCCAKPSSSMARVDGGKQIRSAE